MFKKVIPFRSKLGQFITANQCMWRRWDLVFCSVCLSLKCGFMSVTVRDNVDKNHQSTAYIFQNGCRETQWRDQQPAVFQEQSSTCWWQRAATALKQAWGTVVGFTTIMTTVILLNGHYLFASRFINGGRVGIYLHCSKINSSVIC